MKTVLVLTLGHSYDTAVNAISEQKPDEVRFICTTQTEIHIAAVKSKLEDKHRITLKYQKILVQHDDLESVYTSIKAQLEQLKNCLVSLDLTGGTVPMSLGAWEACQHFPEVVVSWLDFAGSLRKHILVNPNRDQTLH
jgi:CRISPR-associated protein (Cas_Cas02710)